MPGRKDEVYDRSYITQEHAYRVGVTAADANHNGLPVINLDLDMESSIVDPGQNAPVRYQPGYHGHDAVLGIFTVMSSQASTATLKLWRRVDDSLGQLNQTWCFVAERSATGNTVIRVDNLIAGKYRIAVSAFSAGGETISLLVAQTT